MPITHLVLNIHLREQLVDTGRIAIEAECKKFPGARWLHALWTWCQKNGVNVISGSSAPESLYGVDGDKIAWVQEGLEHETDWYRALAHARVKQKNIIHFNLESPLFAPHFWDRAKYIEAGLKMGCGWGNPPEFPAYRASDILPPNPEAWERNEYAVCAVLSNKWQALIPNLELIKTSPSYKHAIAHEQQTARVRFLEQLSLNRKVVVGGHGFGGPDPLALTAFVGEIRPVEDKLQFLNQFPFCVSMENVSHEFYRTEKWIEPMLAGTWAVYPEDILADDKSWCVETLTHRQNDLRDEEQTHPFSETAWVNRIIKHLETL